MDQKIINNAMLFAAKHFNESCHNFGKPVYFHCIKVGMTLFDLGYEEKIIVAGILHDLLEDTDCTSKDIKEAFGEEMAALVEVLSFNPSIEDKFLQSKAMIDECVKAGRDALVVKCMDMYENGKFFNLVTKLDVKEYLIKKFNYFLTVAEPLINNEAVFNLYKKQVENMK